MDIRVLQEQFLILYDEAGEGIRYFFAPGRVNLIGEHTDYNNGFVLPAAISFGTYLLVRPNNRNTFRLATTNFDYQAEISLSSINEKRPGNWVNYPLGVMQQFVNKDIPLRGMDMLYSGNIPAAAGLSSSASIELVTAVAINDILSCGFGTRELVHMALRAEREFVGVQCGIMDQFIVGHGKAGSALFLDCATEHFVHVPFDPPQYRLIIADTRKARKLSDSKYNERVAECRAGLEAINHKYPIGALGELDAGIITELPDLLNDETILKRVRHIVSENHRVKEAVKCLEDGDYPAFGALMNASHDSLRDDYKVTGFELDTLVEAARKQPGVIGSRMTGAGFGGCTVSLVGKGQVEAFIGRVGEEYKRKTDLDAEFYLPEIAQGARKI